MAFLNHPSCFFKNHRCVLQGSVRGPVQFSLFINDALASQPSSVSYSLNAADLAIVSSSLSVPAATETTQRTLIPLKW